MLEKAFDRHLLMDRFFVKTLTERTIYNPIMKDRVTFLKTAADTHGAYTLVEVELAPGGGIELHYHKLISETFICQSGELSVQVNQKTHRLQPKQTVTAAPGTSHRFFNQSHESCRFQCRIVPASVGVERSLQIGYGLARDGQTNAKGMPKSLLTMAWLFAISETSLPGRMSMFEPLLRWQARRAVKKGLDKRLIAQYVRF
jgi:quercetin dioxygenase-like cupin family protein